MQNVYETMYYQMHQLHLQPDCYVCIVWLYLRSVNIEL